MPGHAIDVHAHFFPEAHLELIEPADREEILRGNAARLLGLR